MLYRIVSRVKYDKNMVESTRIEANDARKRVETSMVILAEANAFLVATQNREISLFYKSLLNQVGKAIW